MAGAMRAVAPAQEEGKSHPAGSRSMYRESSPKTTLRVAIEANGITDARTTENTRTRFISDEMEAEKVN